MNRREIMDLINEIEESFPVDTWVVSDIHVWPLIRIPLAMKLYALSSSSLTVKTENIFASRLKSIPIYLAGWLRQYVSSVRDLSGNQRHITNADVFFLNHSTCRFLLNHAWYDVFCGPLIEGLGDLNLNSAIFEFTPRYEYRIPRYQKSSYIQNRIDATKIISKLISAPYLSYRLDKYSEVYEFAFRKCGIEILSIPKLLCRTNSIKRLAMFWEKKLRRVHPKLVFMVTYYGDLGLALNLACTWLGIPSVDIQHGVQGDYHVAYGRWNNVPDTGYELLPHIFWCWSEDEKNAIDSWNNSCANRHQAIAGGNPWLNMWFNDDSSIVKQHDQMLYEPMHSQDEQINFLYTLQPGYDPPDWLLEYIINAPSEWKWWVRLHPGMSLEKERIKSLFARCNPTQVDIDNASCMPLPALLRYIDIHVTQFSTTVIEAADFQIPSIVLHENAEHIYAKYIQMNRALYVSCEDNLNEAIQFLLKKEKQEDNRDLSFKNIFNTHNILTDILDRCSAREEQDEFKI
jgi:hypothetical protein